MTVIESYKAQVLAAIHWLYVASNPPEQPDLVRIQNPTHHLDHAKREVVTSRFFDISADVINHHTAR